MARSLGRSPGTASCWIHFDLMRFANRSRRLREELDEFASRARTAPPRDIAKVAVP